MNCKYSSTREYIEEDFNSKFNHAIKVKDEEIQRLVSKVNDLIEFNDRLSIKNDENLKTIQDLRQN